MRGLRQFLILLAIGLACIWMQATLLRSVLPDACVPNLMLVMAVYLGFYRVSVRGAFEVFLIGVLLDMAAGSLLGPWAAGFIVVFAVLALLARQMFIDSYLAIFVATLFAYFTAKGVYVVLVYEFRPGGLVGFLSLDTVLQGLVTAVVAPWVFKVFRRVLQRSERGFPSGVSV